MQSSYHGRVREDVFALVPAGTRNLLDVGGGTGATAVRIKAAGLAERVGVVDNGADVQALSELDYFCHGDVDDRDLMANLIEREGPFDAILCLDVLEHLVNPWHVIEELHRSLSPNGVIVASIPNMRFYEASFPLFFRGRWELQDEGIRDRTHLRWFVRSTAIELMTSSGLELDYVDGRSGGGRKGEFMRRVALGGLKEFATLHYLVRVRKSD